LLCAVVKFKNDSKFRIVLLEVHQILDFIQFGDARFVAGKFPYLLESWGSSEDHNVAASVDFSNKNDVL
jgi:hypothetical protein